MKDNITCSNGHIYEASLDTCPYCPGGNTEEETVLDLEPTALVDNDNTSDKTVVMDDARSDKTAIHKPESSKDKNESQIGRKLVGWLVSYTWNKEGQDYQLREGKTTIGASPASDICLADSEVSDNHATILYRMNKFRIKDEFSTNGTIIDDKEIEEQAELSDGAQIRIGKTEFIIRII